MIDLSYYNSHMVQTCLIIRGTGLWNKKKGEVMDLYHQFKVHMLVPSVFLCAILGLLICLPITGCLTSYPMGLTASQWDALSPKEQIALTREQYAIDAKASRQERQIRAESIRRDQELRERDYQRLQERRSNARYRDMVTISLLKGKMVERGRLYQIEPFAIDLVRGEQRRIVLRAKGEYNTLVRVRVGFPEQGNIVYIHDGTPERIALVNRSWEKGQDYAGQSTEGPFGIYLRDMLFHVKYTPLDGEPEKVIIERW